MDKKIFKEKLAQIAPEMKQKEFASIMGCSPAAVSKYWNSEKGDCPSIDMLARLADHFNVSIDWLIGRTAQKQQTIQPTIRGICRVLAELHSISKLSFGTVTVTEDCYYENTLDCPGSYHVSKDNTYTSLYFREWFDLVRYDDTELELICQTGNDLPSNMYINTFLSRLQRISDMHAKGDLDQEMYERLLNSYLDDVPDIKY